MMQEEGVPIWKSLVAFPLLTEQIGTAQKQDVGKFMFVVCQSQVEQVSYLERKAKIRLIF